MLKTLGVLSAAALLLTLTACGSDGGSDSLDGVKVTGDETPKIDLPSDYEVSKTATEVLREGDGEEVSEGETLKVDYIAVNGRTGKEFDNSYASERPMVLTLNDQALPGFTKGLSDQRVGSRVLLAVSGEDGAALLQAPTDIGLENNDTMVFVVDIVSKIPDEASGEKQDLPDGSPAVEYDKQKHPSAVKKTDGSPEAFAPKEAKAHVLIAGEGKKVEAGQTVIVQYVGSQYPSGKVFDSSWERGAPTTFPIGQSQVIGCWDDTIVDQPVGSRLLLECGVDTAYGPDAESQGRPDGDLAFVVDVLDAF